jgi:3-oxoacyl-[acyl-carrier protein] reductase
MSKSERSAALVTGASTGIGRAIVISLSAGGYDVAINYTRNLESAQETERLARAAGAKRTALIKADVSQETDVVRMVEEVGRIFDGRLDLLVNNAGTTSDVPPARFETMAVEDFDRVFAVNVRGTFLVTKHAARLLKSMPSASVVNTASIVGMRPGPQPLPYSSSKAAIISMSQTLAGALGPTIRVNAVAPGWLEGDWNARSATITRNSWSVAPSRHRSSAARGLRTSATLSWSLPLRCFSPPARPS